MAELAGDDGDVHAFRAELGGVRVAEAVGVDAFFNASPDGEALEHDPDVGGGQRLTVERAQDGVAGHPDRDMTIRCSAAAARNLPSNPNHLYHHIP